jgi:alpha-L-fucosidase 2
MLDGNHAYKLIQAQLTPVGSGGRGSGGTYNNLFDAHPPFQIDGNFGGAAGIGEMLIQSHTKFIDLLPALPTAFATGEVKGICARGGFILNMKWKEGLLQEVEIVSKVGGDALLRYNGKIHAIKTEKGKTYKLDKNFQVV